MNGPALSVVLGGKQAVAEIEQRLRSDGVPVTRLHTSHAFHSQLMDQAVPLMEQAVAGVKRSLPEIPFLSNVTGNWIRAEEAQIPAYSGVHIRAKVRFADGLAGLFREPDTILLEMGPGTGLASLARQNPLRQPSQPVFSSARHPLDNVCDERLLLSVVGPARLSGGGRAGSTGPRSIQKRRACAYICLPIRSSGSDIGSTPRRTCRRPRRNLLRDACHSMSGSIPRAGCAISLRRRLAIRQALAHSRIHR